ncbi:MAG: uracil-DNA glycosylase [Thaumarchaeota archaeon]|nr:uracil-DNA glycosylase [Nitrososphaerota archaeon]
MTLEEIANEVRNCRLCNLCKERKHAVPGEGSSNADLLFVGEGPGRSEDEQGRPFVGSAGKVLSKLLDSIGLSREEVFITNVVKCRPPENRKPQVDEVTKCRSYLEKQIETIRPKLICVLGATALEALIGESNLSTQHGKLITRRGLKMFVMYHPASALYNNKMEAVMMEDIRSLLGVLKKMNEGGSGKLDEFLE